MYVCVHSHLSWGALLYRFDDGDSVPLFQGKAVASITGPYLRKKHDTSPHQQNPKPADRDTFTERKHTRRSRYWYRKIAAMVVFAHSSEKNAYRGIKRTFCSVMTFPSHSCVLPNDLSCIWFVLSCAYVIANSQYVKRLRGNQSRRQQGVL